MQATFDSYGARIGLDAPGPVVDGVRAAVGGFAVEVEPGRCDETLEVRAVGDRLVVHAAEEEPQACADVTGAVERLLDRMHTTFSRTAPDALFVHAAVFAWRAAVVIAPGRSHTGKSSLAVEAVRQGATYFSDEFAVLDADGLVHPYARSLCLRADDGGRRHLPVAAVPGVAATGPARPTVVLSTWFEAEATWRPHPLTGSRAALPLIDNTVRARQVPAEMLRATSRLASTALTLVGPRGEAAATVAALRDHLGVVDPEPAR